MVNTTTVQSFQAAQTDDEQQPESTGNYLRDLAERALRDRGGEMPHVGDPFDGMDLNIDPADAYGLVEHQVTEWLRERDRWATPLEVDHKTKQLMAEAQNARPGPVKAATYTVGPDGLVNGFQPDAAPAEQTELPEMPANGLRVPRSTEFDADGWADSTALHQRAQVLIERHPDEMEHLEGMTLSFLWKLKGGKSRGRPVMGQCVKAGGLLKHFATSTFIIWLAADHVLAAGYRDREIEALLFRQLLAAGVADVDENTGRGGGATLVPPDVQAYAAELRVYGLWQEQLKSAAQAFRQAPLFSGQPSEFERQEAAGAAYADDEEQGQNDGSGLDCQECGGLIDMERGGSLCPSCKAAERAVQEDGTLVCSVCGKPVDEEEMSLEEVSEAHQNPAVVLCGDCGEDGVIDEGDA